MLRIILNVAIVLLLAPILSYFSGLIVVGHDFSQSDTVGEIQFHGFPIWFKENAPGYSVVDGWHFHRLLYNTFCWTGILIAVLLFTNLVRRRRIWKTSSHKLN